MEYLGHERREGLGRRANSRFILLLLLLVSVLLLLSGLYTAQASVFKKAREGVIDAASPLLEVFSGPIAYFNDVAGSVSDYFNVLEQNEALRQENAELRQWMEEALELREVVASFKGLQTYQAPPDAQPIDAYVIGESNDAFARSMIVNAGRARNVESGQAVVDDNGLVGRVVDTGARASRILLLTDIQSRVPVYVEGADIEGIMVGKTRANPTIGITQSTGPAAVAPGQRVLTSGAGGVMPRGLPVGEVIGETTDGIDVDLYANYVQTRMVRIINYEFPATTDDAVALPIQEVDVQQTAAPTVDAQPLEAQPPETQTPETQSLDAGAADAPAVELPVEAPTETPEVSVSTPPNAIDSGSSLEDTVNVITNDAAATLPETTETPPATILPAANQNTIGEIGDADDIVEALTDDAINEPTEN